MRAKSKIRRRVSARLRRVPFVGRLEFADEISEEEGARGFAGSVIVIHEVAAAPAKDFADGGGCEVGDLGDDVMGAQERENFIGVAEDAAVERIDEKRKCVGVTGDDEVAGQTDGFELEAEALGDEEVDDAQRKGDARAAFEDLVEEAVARVGVVLEVAVKAPLVEHDPVDDATFLAGGRGFDDQFAAPGGDGVELGAAATDLKVGVSGAGEKEGAGFQFVVERADEVAEFADGIAEF